MESGLLLPVYLTTVLVYCNINWATNLSPDACSGSNQAILVLVDRHLNVAKLESWQKFPFPVEHRVDLDPHINFHKSEYTVTLSGYKPK